MEISKTEVRDFLGRKLAPQLEALGIDVDPLPNDLDLLEQGLIDSLGLIELVVAIDEEFDLAVDFEDMDPEQLTVVGPLCEFIAAASTAAES